MRDILSPTVVSAGSSRVTRLSHQRVNESSSNTPNQAARLWTSLPEWMNALKAVALPKRQGLRARVRLHIGECAGEQLLRPVDRQLLGHVHIDAAAIIAPTRVALGVFVGQ